MILNHIDKITEKINSLRVEFKKTNLLTQEIINKHVEDLKPYKQYFRPLDKDELLEIVQPNGESLDFVAPRWFCHLLGLRHKCIHLLLRWNNFIILQTRAWDKVDNPSYLDLSVGGHIINEDTTIESAYKEMDEELGLNKNDVMRLFYRRSMHHLTSYPFSEINEKNNFYNNEWCEVYTTDIKEDSIKNIKFSDGAVVGLYLCPIDQIDNLLNQDKIKLTDAVKKGLKLLNK